MEAGFRAPDGYRMVNIDRVQHRVHRLVWIMHNGPIPDGLLIDHVDRTRDNNRLENLRLATPAQNQTNRGLSKANTSGHTGVSWYPPYKKWRAKISPNRKNITLGYFDTLEEAISARKAAERKHNYLGSA